MSNLDPLNCAVTWFSPTKVPLVPLFCTPRHLLDVWSGQFPDFLRGNSSPSLGRIFGNSPAMASMPTTTDGKSADPLTLSFQSPSIHAAITPLQSVADHFSRPTGRLACLPSVTPHCPLHPTRGASCVSQSPVAIKDPNGRLDFLVAPQFVTRKPPKSPSADREANSIFNSYKQPQACP